MAKNSNIQRVRKEKGFTQAELAEKAGLSEISIRKYENGDRKPKIETLQRIASALDVGLDAFLTNAEIHLFEDMTRLYLDSDSSIKELPISEDKKRLQRKIDLKTKLLNQYKGAYDSILLDIEDLTAESNDLQNRIDKLSNEIQELRKLM